MPTINALAGLSSSKNISLDLEQPRTAVMLAILFISFFAVSFPGVSKQLPFLWIPHLVFFIGKHFGTGVILSTAFCHLLPDAFDSLQRPDINERYHGIGRWTGLIILGSLLSIFLVEYASTAYVDHLHAEPSVPPSSRASTRLSSPSPGKANPSPPQQIAATTAPQQSSSASPFPPMTEASPLLLSTGPTPKRTKSLCNFDHHHSLHNRSREDALLTFLFHSPRLIWGRDVPCVSHMGMGHVALAQVDNCADVACALDMDPDEEAVGVVEDVKSKVGRRGQVVRILILQLGIMIHSLVIGLTLAITTGTDFTSLVTAIIFHQLFEGLSLGIRMAGLPPAHPTNRGHDHSTSSSPTTASSSIYSPSQHRREHPSRWTWATHWLSPTLSVLFAITTPLGILLGTFLFAPSSSSSSTQPGSFPFLSHSQDDDQTARMHLTQGLMSGISAGMLIYAATVEMLAGDFVFGDVGGDHGHVHEHEHAVDVDVGGNGHSHLHTHFHDGQIAHGREHKCMLTPWSRKAVAVASLLAGVAAMALVGLGG